MAKNAVSKKELKEAVREGVREALATELPQIRASLLQAVSDEEQAEIEKRHGTPSRRKERSFELDV